MSDILRIISGTAKGHKIKTIKGNTTRPTTDRVKESLFNIIAPYITGSDVADLFAGTGNLGIEALSRGARSAVFVDMSRECCDVIKENLIHTKLLDRSRIYSSSYLNAIEMLASENKKFDIIFLDPPYSKNFIQETLKKFTINDIIRDDGIIIAEHYLGDVLPEQCGSLELVRCQKYGETVISFFRKIKRDGI